MSAVTISLPPGGMEGYSTLLFTSIGKKCSIFPLTILLILNFKSRSDFGDHISLIRRNIVCVHPYQSE